MNNRNNSINFVHSVTAMFDSDCKCYTMQMTLRFIWSDSGSLDSLSVLRASKQLDADQQDRNHCVWK